MRRRSRWAEPSGLSAGQKAPPLSGPFAASVVHVLDHFNVALAIGVAIAIGILSGHVVHAEVVRQSATLDVGQGGFAGIDAGPQRSSKGDLHICHRLGIEFRGHSVLAVAAPGADAGFDFVFVAALGVGGKTQADAAAGGGEESGGEQGDGAHGEGLTTDG